MIVSGQLTLAAAAQRLSNIYGGQSLNNAIFAKDDLPLQAILLSASGADAFYGATSDVTASVYGGLVDSSDLQPVSLLAGREGAPLKLSDIWIAGAGATIHVIGIVQ